MPRPVRGRGRRLRLRRHWLGTLPGRRLSHRHGPGHAPVAEIRGRPGLAVGQPGQGRPRSDRLTIRGQVYHLAHGQAFLDAEFTRKKSTARAPGHCGKS